MKKLIITLFIAMLALAGCNTNKEEPKKEQKIEAVKVAFQTNPKKLNQVKKQKYKHLLHKEKKR